MLTDIQIVKVSPEKVVPPVRRETKRCGSVKKMADLAGRTTFGEVRFFHEDYSYRIAHLEADYEMGFSENARIKPPAEGSLRKVPSSWQMV